MEEIVNNAVAEIESKEQAEAVETYLALPKAVRREVYSKVKAGSLKIALRSAVEKRRGIADRSISGNIIFTREQAKEQILRLTAKQDLMDERKAKLGERVVELKENARELYGDDFIVEVEVAINSN